MQIKNLLQLSQNPKANGLRLALLNGLIATFCVVSFFGVLLIISLFNQRIYVTDGSASAEIPFPYPLLMLLYVVMFLITWIWFGRGLPSSHRDKMITALIGTSPLFGLSLLGYVSVIGVIIFNKLNPGMIPIASVFVFGFISTLILFAGLTCLGLIVGQGNHKSNAGLQLPTS